MHDLNIVVMDYTENFIKYKEETCKLFRKFIQQMLQESKDKNKDKYKGKNKDKFISKYYR